MAETPQSTPSATAPIIVGTDFQPAARAAADWAAQRSLHLGNPLLLVTSTPAMPVPSRTGVYQAMQSGDFLAEVRALGQQHLDDEANRLRGAYPGLDVSGQLAEGDAAGVIVALSRTARFTVIGTHGKPDVTARLLGGVAEGVISNAAGTVVAVPPGPYELDGPIIAGIDDARGQGDVLRIAYTEAELQQRPLVVLHVWREALFGTPFDVPVLIADTSVLTSDMKSTLTADLAPYRAAHPDVSSTVDVVEGYARDVLVDQTRRASTLVIGARGKGGFLGLLLGSTSRHVVRNAHCPVIIVRPRPA